MWLADEHFHVRAQKYSNEQSVAASIDARRRHVTFVVKRPWLVWSCQSLTGSSAKAQTRFSAAAGWFSGSCSKHLLQIAAVSVVAL
jgi:hypothetical protein